MTMTPRKILLSATAVVALALSANTILAQIRATEGSAASLASPKYGTWGFDATGMDLSVKPGDDFFRYANGKWADRTEIPSDRTRYGNFDQLAELSENRLHAILEDAASGKISDPDASKVAAAYASFMDEALAEQLDAKPIARELAEIRAVLTKEQMTALMGKANTTGFVSILPVFISIDAKAPTAYTVMAATGGLGLPDRDYYLQPAFGTQKAKYQEYAARLLGMIGWENPAESARVIVEFETRLAQDTWTRAERRDRDKTYNPMTVAELNTATPGFDWNR
jgi:putative endopeptidase